MSFKKKPSILTTFPSCPCASEAGAPSVTSSSPFTWGEMFAVEMEDLHLYQHFRP